MGGVHEMPDPVNDELLSAYLDNEVSDEERAVVQRALEESPETRTSYESLKQVQSRLQAIPRLTLAEDFHERVVREAERRSQGHSVMPVTALSAYTVKWIGISTFAATVAAALVVALVIAFNRHAPEIVENPNPVRPDLVQEDAPLPDDEIANLPKFERRSDQKFLVLDMAITKRGHIEGVFNRVFGEFGIILDDSMDGVPLEKELQSELLATRFIAGVNQPDQNIVIEHFDIVDIFYISARGEYIAAIHDKMRKHPEVRVVLDVTLEPSHVLNAVDERTYAFAKSRSKSKTWTGSFAYRLNIGIVLHSSSPRSFLAKFPTPKIKATFSPQERKRSGGLGDLIQLDLDIQPRPENAIEEFTPTEDMMQKVLVIRRQLNGGFPSGGGAAAE